MTDRSFTALKDGKPWVGARPLAVDAGPSDISTALIRRVVPVSDLDELFAGYNGEYAPQEDGFASSAGQEAM